MSACQNLGACSPSRVTSTKRLFDLLFSVHFLLLVPFLAVHCHRGSRALCTIALCCKLLQTPIHYIRTKSRAVFYSHGPLRFPIQGRSDSLILPSLKRLTLDHTRIISSLENYLLVESYIRTYRYPRLFVTQPT